MEGRAISNRARLSAGSRAHRRDSNRKPPRRSEWLVHYFRLYVRHFVRENFHALRIANDGLRSIDRSGPLIVVMNHPSWWDPMIGTVLADCLTPGRKCYAPMDSVGLSKYRVLAKLGFFGIDQGTISGARSFLRTCETIFAEAGTGPAAAVWVTAEGSFTDVRDRPVRIRSGIAHVAARLNEGWIVPLAIEYPFWNERYPEALVRFGEPMPLADGLSAKAWKSRIEHALESTLDALSIAARRRNPGDFEILLKGRAGEGGVYDACRRLASWLRGRRYHPEHEENSSDPM